MPMNTPETDRVALRLSEILDVGVYAGADKIGTLQDFVIVDKDKVAVVTYVVVERPFGRPSLYVPWEKVADISARRATLNLSAAAAENLVAAPSAPVLLKDFVLDKKVLDVAEREVEVVYDILLSLRRGVLYVVEVDISRFARLSRLGLGWLARLLYRTSASADAGAAGDAERRQDRRTVPWSYVQALPANIGSLKGELRLKVLKDQLSKIPPVDVADILEELDPEQRIAVFHQLDVELASDTLESLNPKFQRDMVSALKKEKAAQLVAEMTPGQAADLLAVLPMAEAQAILKLLPAADAEKVRNILREQEARIADFADGDFLKFSPETTVAQARATLQRSVRERPRDAIMYVYVLDAAGALVGVVALAELLLADDPTELGSIMKRDAIALRSEDTMREAAKLFARYGLRALPVVDGAGRMLGILPARDVLALRGRDLG